MSRNQSFLLIVIIAAGALVFLTSSSDILRTIGLTSPGIKLSPTPSGESLAGIKADANITLRNMQGSAAVGSGSRKLADDVYRIGVRVEKLMAPTPGKQYRAWLVRDAGVYDGALPLGTLQLAQDGANKGNYLLGAEVKGDVRMYKGMIVTLQSAGDQQASNIILEGVFK